MPEYRHLDEELAKLRVMLLDMIGLVDEQLSITANALLQCDPTLAQQVLKWDDKVDALELAVDEQYELVLALQQPVAVDLRFLIASTKMNKDLERIGDQCKNIAKAIPHLAGTPEVVADLILHEMADLARAMLRQAQDAFSQRDRLQARQVITMDQRIDRLYDKNIQSLIEYGQQHPEHLEGVVHLVLVNKAFERIGDHIKNMGEDVIFFIEAVDIRHPNLPDMDA